MTGSRSHIFNIIVACGMLMALSACNGVMDGIYDDPPMPAEGDIYIDATSWTQWHYICLHDGSVVTYDIPTAEVASFDSDGTGIYTYWYDVFGEGVSKYELRDKYPTEHQPEPDHWDIAVHRNNVRTNGGAVYQTSVSDISSIGSATSFSTMPFVEDTWNETDVWAVQTQMLEGLVGNQRIKINTELGKWLTMDIPPMPPTFGHNDRVFILRLSDGTYAALRLKNYKTPESRNCGLTVEYKYPL